MADSLINITFALEEPPASVAERVLDASNNAHTLDGVRRLVRELGSTAAKDCKILARVDSVTRGASAGTIVCTQASATAGDILHIKIPGFNRVDLTAVAGTASDGQYSIDTSDTAMGDSVASAINNHWFLKRHLSASNASGTVTVTALEPGSWGDDIDFAKTVTTGGTLTLTDPSGGDDILDQPTMDVVFGTPDIVADDTISVGAVEFTWKASASSQDEITLSTTETTAATNFGAAINAHTDLTGIVTASVASATVTLTFVGDPRLAQHIGVTYVETNAGSVVPAGTANGLGAEFPLIGTTVTGNSTTRTYGSRGTA